MAFARLFPIDVANAQDGDRTFSERLGLSDDARCSLQSPRRVPALALLKQSAAAVATSRESHRSPRSGREGQHRRWGQEQNSSAFNYQLEGNFGADSDYERPTCT